MKHISTSALVSFSVEQMFSLVNDVSKYADFLPGCSGSRVIESFSNSMLASIDVSKAGVHKTFITLNKFMSSSAILMHLIDGPFKDLKGGWYFTLLDEQACKIELKLEFEFSSKIAEAVFDQFFNQISSDIINVFSKRAEQVYK
ncbi:ribosome association toxin [Candidatus Photodesmus blepharus]|uniref:Ribosome association toxin n=1 Tax=Candidatus Photodesmus blepharonis TaxID=1179155 RepID=A0A084CPE8_9GAMM|nr:ubiquinone-binding protein [Candidatus Photodesmus blepharus]KEY91677.1 ribosome association toxin [Candidatus Photodesmus blepharus]